MTIKKQVSLVDVADILGVHYMTAYRYVREGRLPASKVGRSWVVEGSDLRAFRQGQGQAVVPKGGGRKEAPWLDRMVTLLVQGDERGAMALMEAVLRSGHDLYFLYLDVLAPAMVAIGERWKSGDLDVFVEHRATGIVTRLMARIGVRFAKRGVRKGTVIIGSPEGELHILATAMLADLIQLEGWKVDNLGANVPADSFSSAVVGIPDVVAVCVATTMQETLQAASNTIAKIKEVTDNAVPCFIGGAAVTTEVDARLLGADYWASDARQLISMLSEYTARA